MLLGKLAYIGAFVVTMCLAPSEISGISKFLSKPEFLRAMRSASFGSCDPKSQPNLQKHREKFEPWLLEEFNATEDERSELNCALFLSCLSKKDFNLLFLKKLSKINDKNGLRAYHLLRQLNYHQAAIKDQALIKFPRSDDFSVLEQTAIYCVRTEYAPCILKLEELVRQLNKLQSSDSVKFKMKMLQKQGIKLLP